MANPAVDTRNQSQTFDAFAPPIPVGARPVSLGVARRLYSGSTEALCQTRLSMNQRAVRVGARSLHTEALHLAAVPDWDRGVIQRMSWMLSRHPPDYPRLDDVALTYGRALMLATNFEQSCRVLLRFLNLVDVLDHDPTLLLEAAIQRVPCDGALKRTLEGIASQLGTVPDAVVILVNAREGRNFIAHEAASWPPLNMPRHGGTREILAPTAVGRDADRLRALERLGEPLRILRRHVAAVAHGEVLVGGWLHEFHERERAPATFTQSYHSRVDNWVLEPVMDLLSD